MCISIKVNTKRAVLFNYAANSDTMQVKNKFGASYVNLVNNVVFIFCRISWSLWMKNVTSFLSDLNNNDAKSQV
jgi:hypothetical protein